MARVTFPPLHPSLKQEKNRHHIAPEAYLKGWADAEGLVSCFNKPTGRLMQRRHPASVGYGLHFYDLPSLTHADFGLLRDYVTTEPDEGLRNLCWLAIEALIQRVYTFETQREIFEQQEEMASRVAVWRKNAIENFHESIENEFWPILDQMKVQDLSFYRDIDGCLKFLRFLADQHVRTAFFKNKVVAVLKTKTGKDFSNVWNVIAQLEPVRLSALLLEQRACRRLTPLVNTTEVDFITGDQPVIHIEQAQLGGPRPHVFYYPVSPRLAYTLGTVTGIPRHNPSEMTEGLVDLLNGYIFSASHRHVIASSDAVLLRTKVFVERRKVESS